MHNIDFDLRWSREDRADRHGRTIEEARELWRQAAQSATCCGECFRPLSPTASVTMEARNVGRRHNQHWLRVPICLLCTLDRIRNNWRGCDVFYETPRWRRTRCLNCERPIRIYGDSRNARTCCADCQRAMRYQRNNLRRRVEHEPIACIECGQSFIPKRNDTQTCSNRCRQALYRDTHSTWEAKQAKHDREVLRLFGVEPRSLSAAEIAKGARLVALVYREDCGFGGCTVANKNKRIAKLEAWITPRARGNRRATSSVAQAIAALYGSA